MVQSVSESKSSPVLSSGTSSSVSLGTGSQGGLKYTFAGMGGGGNSISGLGHKISCQTRNTIESLIESESGKNSHMTFFHLQLFKAYYLM